MSKARQIVDGIAYALWAHALAGFVTDHPNDHYADEYNDLIYGNGKVPDEAMKPAMELANLYELANGRPLAAMYGADPTGWEDEVLNLSPREYGAALASNALRVASPKVNVEPVTFKIEFTGESLVWEGDIAPRVNPPRGIPGGGAGGPVRAGEHSRFRETLRGVERATAVIPRRHREYKAVAPRPVAGPIARTSVPPAKKRKR
jgi:hypothetical protein